MFRGAFSFGDVLSDVSVIRIGRSPILITETSERTSPLLVFEDGDDLAAEVACEPPFDTREPL